MPAAIPSNHFLEAAKDVELKKLIRARETAANRVAKALHDEGAAEDAIEAYIGQKYPATVSHAEEEVAQ